MPLGHNVSGTWKDCAIWHNVSGTWKKCALWHNVSGTWKQITTLLASLLPATITVWDSAISTADANATLTLGSGGGWSSSDGGSGTWMSGGSGSDYDAMMTTVSGTLTTGTAGTWQNLGTSRTWGRNETRNGNYTSTYVGTLQVRMAASPYTVLSTTTVTLEAVVEI